MINFSPMINIEDSTPLDITSILLSKRIITIYGEIDDKMSEYVIIAMKALEILDSTKEIQLLINSPGGSITAGLAIYDVMQQIKTDVSTVCCGLAASMASVILAGGTSGKRKIMPNADVMIHQLSGSITGNYLEMENITKRTKNLKNRVYHILSEHCGKSIEEIERDCMSDYYLNASNTLNYGKKGICDVILGTNFNGV